MADPTSSFADFASTAENTSDAPIPVTAGNAALRDKAIRNIYPQLQDLEQMTALLPAQKAMRRDILIQEEIERIQMSVSHNVDVNAVLHPHAKVPLAHGRGTPVLPDDETEN